VTTGIFSVLWSRWNVKEERSRIFGQTREDLSRVGGVAMEVGREVGCSFGKFERLGIASGKGTWKCTAMSYQ
jgi:hypothetical protein